MAPQASVSLTHTSFIFFHNFLSLPFFVTCPLRICHGQELKIPPPPTPPSSSQHQGDMEASLDFALRSPPPRKLLECSYHLFVPPRSSQTRSFVPRNTLSAALGLAASVCFPL